jgi:RNA polymerase-binding transcription factor DksA
MNKLAIRRRLIEQQNKLLSLKEAVALGSLADGSQSESMGDLSGADQHMADAGTETFEREKDMSILSGVEAELADVEWALRRLADGTYGTCQACGRPIGAARLEARPATRFCIEDQSRKEREVRTA